MSNSGSTKGKGDEEMRFESSRGTDLSAEHMKHEFRGEFEN